MLKAYSIPWDLDSPSFLGKAKPLPLEILSDFTARQAGAAPGKLQMKLIFALR